MEVLLYRCWVYIGVVLSMFSLGGGAWEEATAASYIFISLWVYSLIWGWGYSLPGGRTLSGIAFSIKTLWRAYTI